MMELTKLKVAWHRKSAWAQYKVRGYTLDVYLMNNEPCINAWGNMEVITHFQKNSAALGETERTSFTSYADFRQYRKELFNKFNQQPA